jgi:hypothetical protein
MAEFAGPVQTENSFLAALMASLIAQCTEEARRSGGSPDAADKDQKHIMSGEFKLQLTQFNVQGRGLNCEKRLTFGREDALLVTGAVDQLNVELLWDGVDRGDLVRPCAIVDDQPVRVGCVLLVCEEAYSLDECTFHLC